MVIQHQEFKYRSVYLSDLRSIINLYTQTEAQQDPVQYAKPKLTDDFGLPLSIAEVNQKIIAYSSIHIDKSGKSTIKIHTNNAIEHPVFLDELKEFTQNKFNETWGKNQDSKPEKQIKNAIASLIRWLNLCD